VCVIERFESDVTGFWDPYLGSGDLDADQRWTTYLGTAVDLPVGDAKTSDSKNHLINRDLTTDTDVGEVLGDSYTSNDSLTTNAASTSDSGSYSLRPAAAVGTMQYPDLT